MKEVHYFEFCGGEKDTFHNTRGQPKFDTYKNPGTGRFKTQRRVSNFI